MVFVNTAKVSTPVFRQRREECPRSRTARVAEFQTEN
jgi:hypothetical protein